MLPATDPSPEILLTEVPPATPDAALQAPRTALVFTGSGAEYFRIWAINLTFTILTLGLYSAWAKVRRLQYFYQHTLLDGSAFNYVANPRSILLGRLIALVLLVAYYLAFEYSATAGLLITLMFIAGLPYLLWQSNRFKARNTRYRGLAFGFEGPLSGAYKVYAPVIAVAFGPAVMAAYLLGAGAELWILLVSLLSLLIFPVFHALFRQYVQSNLRFGDAPFRFLAGGKDFLSVWMWGIGACLAIGLFAGFFAFAIVALTTIAIGKGGSLGGVLGLGGAFLMIWLMFLLLSGYFAARFQQLVWNSTRVGTVELACQVSAMRYLSIVCTNTLLVILSLGLYRPFAAIRLARFRLECVSASNLVALGGIAVGSQQSRRGAAGESAAELFDMDVGL